MKKLFMFGLLFASLFSFASCGEPSVEKTPEPTKETLSKKSVKILAIGNSFSDDAMVNYMYKILKSFGVEEVILGNMYIPGCTLETHYNNAVNNTPAYTYRKVSSKSATPGVWTHTEGFKMIDSFREEKWDLVTFQQGSHDSGTLSTYKQEQLDYLTTLARGSVDNPNLKIAWHMTWAYHKNTQHSAFPKYNKDQDLMYASITTCVERYILTNKNFDFVIPAGTAVQNARTSYLGDGLTEPDGYHLNNLGDYLIGITWILKYSGWDVSEIDSKLVPSEFIRDIEVIKESAVNAVKKQFSVTQSTILEKPALNIDLTKYEKLDWQPTFGHWNSTGGDYDKIITSMKGFVCSGKRFTKNELPVGSIIIIESGWQYRPDGWDGDGANTVGRPGNVSTEYVEVDEAWWGEFKYRAFNVSCPGVGDLSERVEEAGSKLTIYVPKA